jgi:hypothetical protein
VLLMYFVKSAQNLRAKFKKVVLLVSLRGSEGIVSFIRMGRLFTVGMLLLMKM